MSDRWRDRIQLEFGVSWRLMPGAGENWRQWFFDPACGLTRIGQRLENGRVRQQLPDPFRQGYVDIVEGQRDPISGLRKDHFISRVFWLRGAVRVLGLDVGAGLYYRKEWVRSEASA